jgi:hypothetical protein
MSDISKYKNKCYSRLLQQYKGMDKPQPLNGQERDPIPIVQEAGWVSGPVWRGAENLVHTGIPSPDRPACSQSLYRLS